MKVLKQFFLCEAPAERLASVKASTLSYWASGLVGCVLTIWVTSQWNIFSLKKLSVVFSDQYRLYSDMPVSFNMLSAASPWWASNLLISEQTERLDCWTPLGPRRTVQNRTSVGISGDFEGRYVPFILLHERFRSSVLMNRQSSLFDDSIDVSQLYVSISAQNVWSKSRDVFWEINTCASLHASTEIHSINLVGYGFFFPFSEIPYWFVWDEEGGHSGQIWETEFSGKLNFFLFFLLNSRIYFFYLFNLTITNMQKAARINSSCCENKKI